MKILKIQFLILAFIFVFSTCNVAYAQSSTAIYRTCAGTNPNPKQARVEITKDGSIIAVSCSGKTVVLNGTTYTGSSSANFVDFETPGGTINGTNTVFTLAFTPTTGSLHLFRNGLLQLPAIDYTLSGTTITYLVAPPNGNTLRASYRK